MWFASGTLGQIKSVKYGARKIKVLRYQLVNELFIGKYI